MNSTFPAWIGADPGRAGCFGICLLYADRSATTANVDCADDAVTFVRENLQEAPGGAAVDAPLWWSSGRSADRCADRWLRERYGLTGGEVQTANSLRGAALVQGVMFVTRIREHYPAACLWSVYRWNDTIVTAKNGRSTNLSSPTKHTLRRILRHIICATPAIRHLISK